MATDRALPSLPPEAFPDRRLQLIYKPLDLAHFETRFSKIFEDEDPPSAKAPVRCKLSAASLLDPRDTCFAEINGVALQITRNLDLALRGLRRKGESPLWIDAICVNQSDAYEKGQQILRMGHIYSVATKVVAWTQRS